MRGGSGNGSANARNEVMSLLKIVKSVLEAGTCTERRQSMLVWTKPMKERKGTYVSLRPGSFLH